MKVMFTDGTRLVVKQHKLFDLGKLFQKRLVQLGVNYILNVAFGIQFVYISC